MGSDGPACGGIPHTSLPSCDWTVPGITVSNSREPLFPSYVSADTVPVLDTIYIDAFLLINEISGDPGASRTPNYFSMNKTCSRLELTQHAVVAHLILIRTCDTSFALSVRCASSHAVASWNNEHTIRITSCEECKEKPLMKDGCLQEDGLSALTI